MPFALRYMIDRDIVGMQWVKVNLQNCQIRKDEKKVSTCQYEFDVIDYTHLEPIPLSKESKIGPLRILSFDIECSAKKGKFPTPD